ncbi:hypothetical protein TD95_001988 [Thielaviopsis punctulata]|uniref:Actin-related protein RO7 n=1 Tax=Thielaviopsis punctulata TaxID=72032 RepID=A0A0F4ZBE8_9PEZI|nr:hypothetical protein TD95_001988 [Thielaviopsis punctulata]
MASTPSAGLPHRAITNIRNGGASGVGASSSSSNTDRTTPSTPSRTTTATFSSPSTLRAEEDLVIVELGSRFVRVGFAGDNAPKARLQLAPDQQRRIGDFRVFLPGYHDAWRKRPTGKDWGKDYELWQYNLREANLGLIHDKLERVLRDAFSRLLLIDSRPRRMAIIVPSMLPLPLLSTTLEILFKRFHSPTVSLLSSPVMATIGAGVRSGLVVDMGWNETVVTSIYEYREVRCTRSVRAGKMLIEELHKLLHDELIKHRYLKDKGEGDSDEHVVSFEEVEEVANRLMWCRASEKSAAKNKSKSEGLPTVQEQDETEDDTDTDSPRSASNDHCIEVPLRSVGSHCRINLSFARLADVCEGTFLDDQRSAASSFDDNELPLHLLIYNHLLRLPLDVRAICMARIMFVGGNSRIIGLKGRIYDELLALVEARGWNPVTGRGAEAYKTNPKLRRTGSSAGVSPKTPTATTPPAGTTPVTPTTPGDGVWHDAANATAEEDKIEVAIQKTKGPAPVQGQMRALESIGAWCGASLACHLKVMAIAGVDREVWLQTGLAGAVRTSEVDFKSQSQRLSMGMGSGGLMRAAANIQEKNWTLGAWGAI